MIKKRNYVIASISALLFVVGYIIIKLFFSKVPTFSYTADWAVNHYFLFVWVPAILLAIFSLPYTSLALTIGCFVGIVLGDVIGQNIIDNKWHEINQLINNGIEVSAETLNRADYHNGVFIWLGTILICAVIGLLADILNKRRLRLNRN
ncbi:MAG: hypothetical protein PHR21_06950 [Oscillospiraceae bacterium]|nr:hypothetical protein [Oscillospiraceae bacterium]MDD4368575.1 hypothetical protein [Oscillospiraceae bacterium]